MAEYFRGGSPASTASLAYVADGFINSVIGPVISRLWPLVDNLHPPPLGCALVLVPLVSAAVAVEGALKVTEA